jgi:hypothetical protein
MESRTHDGNYYARVVGAAYLLAMATSMFAEGYVRGSLLVPNDAMATARNIIEHRTFFRVGIAFEMLTFTTDIVLITGLFVILSPVHRPLALFATFMRLVAEAIALVMAANSFEVVRILGGGQSLKVFSDEQLAALARVQLLSHDAMYGVTFIVLGIGSTVFGYLWLESRYIPRALAVLAIVGSSMLSAGALAILVVPRLIVLYPIYMMPLFFFEVGGGLWLLFNGLRLNARTS